MAGGRSIFRWPGGASRRAGSAGTETLYAAVGNSWFGYHLYASTDGGRNWTVPEKGLSMDALPGCSLTRIWHIAAGAPDEPDVVYLGADPGALFRSADNGATWEMAEGLTTHATREKWTPGAGGPMVHSIQALGKGRLIVGIRGGGVPVIRFREDMGTIQRKSSVRFPAGQVSRGRPVRS